MIHIAPAASMEQPPRSVQDFVADLVFGRERHTSPLALNGITMGDPEAGGLPEAVRLIGAFNQIALANNGIKAGLSSEETAWLHPEHLNDGAETFGMRTAALQLQSALARTLARDPHPGAFSLVVPTDAFYDLVAAREAVELANIADRATIVDIGKFVVRKAMLQPETTPKGAQEIAPQKAVPLDYFVARRAAQLRQEKRGY
jgi:hypothetical protein